MGIFTKVFRVKLGQYAYFYKTGYSEIMYNVKEGGVGND